MGVGKTQIQSVMKRKRDIIEEYEGDGNLQTKRPRKATEYDDLNDLVHKWFLDATGRHVNISGPLLKERALKFAAELGLASFKASNGWLDSFLRRHNIVFKTRTGERAEVDPVVVDDWKKRLPTICEGYQPCDIYNMDETGLFYKQSTSATFFKKGETCAGGKMAKERITVGLCASVTGDKLPPIIIGKSKKTRCFGSVTPDKLPIRYYNNKKAWMTTGIMEDWLKWFDRRMRHARRHVILFIDNAPSHPRITLTNIKLQFLPPNTTSVIQPMDQGIIQTMKLKYRKRQLQHVMMELERSSATTGPQILKEVNILQAIYWVISAWKETTTETIGKCFAKCGFMSDSEKSASASDSEKCADDITSDKSDKSECDDVEDDLPLIMHKLAHDLFGCEVKDLINIDRDFTTCATDMDEWKKSAPEILQEDGCDEEDDTNPTEEEATTSETTLSMSEVVEMSRKLKDWAVKKGHHDLLATLMEASNQIGDIAMNGEKVKQTKIEDFFFRPS
ncbi:tigger transposable element-derived protein 4-like [Dreissena polymorpha]|uniref:tigger transposable element-derived protein 4-like n=1 Tax=Dreissena polymorpha TaxID=45954 RepID=UPI0022651889|nr:tigger transposable element-derived protein 4-like [Dreissena polymorpha]